MIRRLLYNLSSLLLTACLLMQIISASFIGLNVYASAEGISVEFYNGDTSASTSSMSPNFKVSNTGSSAIGLSDIKLRYYFTDDGVSPISIFIDYAENNGSGINSCITYTIEDANSTDANKYIEFGFNTAAGSLAPNTSATIRVRVYQSDYSQFFTQTNDYSFCETSSAYVAWEKVTAYFDGVLFSGTEPVMVIPTSSPITPAPQMSPIPTITPSPSVTHLVIPTPSNFEPILTPAEWLEQAVPNGDFEGGMACWSFYYDSISGANASSLVYTEPSGNKRSETSIVNTGPSYWSIRLKHPGIVLENAKTYRLTFDAKATILRDIRVSLQDDVSNLIEYFSNIMSVDSNMKTYALEFTMNSSTDTSSAIVFEMGKVGTMPNQTHDIIIDNVDLEEIVTPIASTSPAPIDGPVGIDIAASRVSVSDAELGDEAEILLSQGGEISVEGTIDAEKEIVLIIDNSGALNSYMDNIISPLDFGIYSNHDMVIQGDNASINGNVHANNLFKTTAGRINISQTCSATAFDIISPNADINQYKNITTPIEMPYFHSKLINDAMSNSMVFKPENYPPSWFPYPIPGHTDVYVTYNAFAKRFEIFGDGTLTISSSMYFKGNVMISLKETNNINEGFIVADGDIIIQGKNLYPSGPNDKLYVYSIGGNIEFQTEDSTINGIAYAPGNPANPDRSGNIKFVGKGNTMNGAIAGDDLSFHATNLKVNQTEGQFTTIEEKYFENTSYLNSVKESAKGFIDKFAGSQTKISVIQYSDSANDNDFAQYDLSLSSNATILKENIDDIVPGTTGFSNMGDAMRRAYHILNNSGSDLAIKYIVVLTGSVPNRWTGISDGTQEPKTGDGTADYINEDDVLYSSLDYAKEIGNIITSKDINLLFIDFSNEDIGTELEEIATASGTKEIESTGKHYYRADNFMELTDIFDSIRFNTIYNVTLNNVLYEEILPAGVLLVEAPEWVSTQSVQIGGMSRTKLSGTINKLPLTFNGVGYTFDINSFGIKVRFMKPGTIVFQRSDSWIRYNIDYIAEDGNSRSETLDKYFDDMTVNVTMSIDIN